MSKSDDEIQKELTYLEKLSEFHENNPALKDAYEQIQVIRSLKGFRPDPVEEQEENWFTKYNRLVQETEFDENDKAVQEAWEKYYMLKTLIGKKENE